MGNVIYLNWREGERMDRHEIEKIAEKIREEYSINEFPVDPARIASKLAIPVKEVTFKRYNDDSVSGGIIKEKNSVKIYVNKTDSMNRKRFTIAHELGHYFLKHLENKGEYVDMHREALYTNDPNELDANEFAACLLMQSDIVINKFKVLKNVGFSQDYIIYKLSEIFIVSQAAMKNRLRNLRLI